MISFSHGKLAQKYLSFHGLKIKGIMWEGAHPFILPKSFTSTFYHENIITKFFTPAYLVQSEKTSSGSLLISNPLIPMFLWILHTRSVTLPIFETKLALKLKDCHRQIPTCLKLSPNIPFVFFAPT